MRFTGIIIIIIIMVLALMGCGSMPMQHFADPTVYGITNGAHEVCMTVIVENTPADVARNCARWLGNVGYPLGCALTFANDARAIIIPRLIDANDINMLALIGHEYLHATFGEWHATEYPK